MNRAAPGRHKRHVQDSSTIRGPPWSALSGVVRIWSFFGTAGGCLAARRPAAVPKIS
jgi:hypothetical protein